MADVKQDGIALRHYSETVHKMSSLFKSFICLFEECTCSRSVRALIGPIRCHTFKDYSVVAYASNKLTTFGF